MCLVFHKLESVKSVDDARPFPSSAVSIEPGGSFAARRGPDELSAPGVVFSAWFFKGDGGRVSSGGALASGGEGFEPESWWYSSRGEEFDGVRAATV